MMNFELDNMFEEEDPRHPAYDYLQKLHRGQLSEDEAKEALKSYFELRDLCYEKFKQLADKHNPYTMIASIHLCSDPDREHAEATVKHQLELFEEFNDVMLSVIMLRTMEEYGNADKPFLIKLVDSEQEKTNE